MAENEVFGTDDQRALLLRGAEMARLLADDWRYTYYGRTVGLARPADGDLDRLIALVRLQGNAAYADLAPEQAVEYAKRLRMLGLNPVQYVKWQGSTDAIAAARTCLADIPLPDDVTALRLDAQTDGTVLQALALMASEAGVLLPRGAVLRGMVKPAACFVAMDPQGAVVSCAAACAYAHPDHPTLGADVWWGMLATAPERRGQRIAVRLGAMALMHMVDAYDARAFFTGVAPGNAPSEAVCRRMGLHPSQSEILGCADPASLKSGRMTK
ncbi:N-acetyltransferase [Cognatishimia sp. F0-27]|uniref:N-acetyltransferase n=1 Tax=Cognatishimia sp. F0-27 TaxID=2816855 RepID=UPI001D0C8D6A|nr:N-acetyltransferase [Cognatishimia sp. F0-27]MCC1494896.1 N-acetyltransferase [Cognatishimia sp. F0-27]